MSDGSREPAEYLAYFVLIVAEIVFAIGIAFWFAGQVAGLLTGHGWPHSSPADIVTIMENWVKHPGDPARAWPAVAAAAVGPAWLVFFVFIVLCVILAFLTVQVVRLMLNFRRRQPLRYFRLGFAPGNDIRRSMGVKAVIAKANDARPSYRGRRDIEPTEVGFYLGRDIRSQRRLFSSVNETLLVVSAPSQGKEPFLCDQFTIDAPGACIHTSFGSHVMPSFVNIYASRAKVGRVLVFDPIGLTNWPDRFRWSPVAGAERPRIANERARAFIHGAGFRQDGEGANFVTSAIMVLRCYLHAAALGGRTLLDVIRWSTRPTDPEPVALLREAETTGSAARGWAMALEAAAQANPEHSGAVWATVVQALNSFSDPKVLEACSPGPDEVFNLREFLSGRNTLFVVGDRTVTPVATALMEDLLYEIYRIARQEPNARLDPPLTVELNDAANLVPMPNLPTYVGEAVYQSIALHVYVSSLSGMRSTWGAGLWEQAAIRMVLGGTGNASELEELSKTIGDLPKKSRGAGNLTSDRVLSPLELRTMPRGRAVVMARLVRPVEVQLREISARKDGQEIAAGKAETTQMIRTYTQLAEEQDPFTNYAHAARGNTNDWDEP
ncbi:hypothetical protein GCM10023322_39250 [Rugosimonospora acidiphila]|uniref:TraD/TraG TraM recognition site domain-containing protein n=1 Tax=Rugosimonospora acidiphila TaxID=556531 RepID=A0ABP9RWL4_9ACTN